MNTRFPRGHNAHLVGQSYVLHGTTIAKWDRATHTITLNSGGWQTATTKVHMNDVLNYLGAIWRVAQVDFQWIVYPISGMSMPVDFTDGMTFDYLL